MIRCVTTTLHWLRLVAWIRCATSCTTNRQQIESLQQAARHKSMGNNICTASVASWQGGGSNCLILNFSVWENFRPKIPTFYTKIPILGDLGAKLKLCTHNVFCRKFAVVYRKIATFCPFYFLAHGAADSILAVVQLVVRLVVQQIHNKSKQRS